MSTYKIEVNYRTGDTFGAEDRTDFLDITWTNKEIVKENLKAIEEHYKLYMMFNKDFNLSKEQQKKERKKAESKWWFGDTTYWEYQLMLKKDDGTLHRQSTGMWCGYFESLWSAEIKVEEDDMKVNFRKY